MRKRWPASCKKTRGPMTTIPAQETRVNATISETTTLRVEQALRLLPDVEDLRPLRGLVVSLCAGRKRQAWTAAEPNRTIGKRTFDPSAVRARMGKALDGVQTRVAFLYEAAVDALESEQTGDLSRAVRALMRAGAYEEEGVRYVQAHAWYKQALGLAEQLRDRQPEMEALCNLERALDTFEALGDSAGVVRTLLARGVMEAAQGRLTEVLATYREALSRLPVTDRDPVLELSVRLRLAELYLDLGRFPDAEDETRHAEDVAITYQQTRWLARIYLIMGKLRGRQGDEAGLVLLEQAIDLCRQGESARRLEADVYCEYARFRAIMGDRDEARAYLERARELLEPFGDDAARERIDEDLQRLTQ